MSLFNSYLFAVIQIPKSYHVECSSVVPKYQVIPEVTHWPGDSNCHEFLS